MEQNQMSIDMLNLPPDEAERIAYAENFSSAAKLFGRLADAQSNQMHTTQMLKKVLDTATTGNTAELTKVVFEAYIFLERMGVNIDPANTLEDITNG
jgi:hypothetical protein